MSNTVLVSVTIAAEILHVLADCLEAAARLARCLLEVLPSLGGLGL